MTSFIARWDLDKTYLRTDFDTLRDLLRTALERPDQKRTVPGAAALMRELGDADVAIHILSGSPEQLRRRLEQKLELDAVRYESLTLKPNLQNILRLRFKALRGQLGYKLTSLLRRRCELTAQRDASGAIIREALLGDDAEADAFVYSLYADVCEGAVRGERLERILRAGGCYDDDIADCLRFASYLEEGTTVERILIHLERQSAPSDFQRFGRRVVPFFNYMQAAFVLYEDRRLPPRSVLRVAQEMATRHHFDGGSLGRSYLELGRRGSVTGRGIAELGADYAAWIAHKRVEGASELGEMIGDLEAEGREIPAPSLRGDSPIDYEALVAGHNPRHKKRAR